MRKYNNWTEQEKEHYRNNLSSELINGGIDIESAVDMAIEISYKPEEYLSTGMMNLCKEVFKELEHKGWEWRSFYNGWLEAWTRSTNIMNGKRYKVSNNTAHRIIKETYILKDKNEQ